MKDKELLKSLCGLCENDVKTCRYTYLIRRRKICPYFNPKYGCAACTFQCGDDLLCYRFEQKNKVLTIQSHPVETSVKKLLSNLMQMEKSTEDAISKFKQSLETNGIKADLLDSRLMGYINNLIALHTLDLLIASYGLKDFRVQILEKEIDRLFAPKQKMKTAETSS